MHAVALGLIVKDDTRVLREWLAYHIAIGVTHVWIAINEKDPTEVFNVLRPFISNQYVTAFHYPGETKQLAAYNTIIEQARGVTRWLGLLDSDEFVHLRKEDGLPQFMQRYELADVAALVVRWRIFGSNRHRCIQPSVLEAFTRRADDDFNVHELYKSFVRPERVKEMANPHMPIVKNKFRIVDEQLVTVPNDVTRYVGQADLIRINHYYCRSVEDYARKMWRGRADTPARTHNWDEFKAYDQNGIQDEEILRHMPRVRSLVEEICRQSL